MRVIRVAGEIGVGPLPRPRMVQPRRGLGRGSIHIERMGQNVTGTLTALGWETNYRYHNKRQAQIEWNLPSIDASNVNVAIVVERY